MLGLRSPLPPTTYERFIPEDTVAFRRRLGELLGEFSPKNVSLNESVRFTNSIGSLARHGLNWLSMMEVLGKPPEFEQFSEKRYFKQFSNALAPELDEAWRIYSHAVLQALEETKGAESQVPPPRMRTQEARGETPRREAVVTVSDAGTEATQPPPHIERVASRHRGGFIRRLLGRN